MVRMFWGGYCEQLYIGNSNVAAGYVDADKCQTTYGPGGLEDYLPLLYCSKDESCENSPNALYQVFDGAKCANSAGFPKGKQVCYRGECVTNLEVCSKAAAKSKGKSAGRRSIGKSKGKGRNSKSVKSVKGSKKTRR